MSSLRSKKILHLHGVSVLKQTGLFYIDSFKGLSREVWLLAMVTFINRAGTMVIPFLSLFLTEDMGLSLIQIGWVMSSFGVGSVLGSWLGGKLTDRIGFYEVMLEALGRGTTVWLCAVTL